MIEYPRSKHNKTIVVSRSVVKRQRDSGTLIQKSLFYTIPLYFYVICCPLTDNAIFNTLEADTMWLKIWNCYRLYKKYIVIFFYYFLVIMKRRLIENMFFSLLVVINVFWINYRMKDIHYTLIVTLLWSQDIIGAEVHKN